MAHYDLWLYVANHHLVDGKTMRLYILTMIVLSVYSHERGMDYGYEPGKNKTSYGLY